MKVLHVISSVSPRNGGPSRAITDIEQVLAARGIDVTTVTTDQDGPGRRLGVRCGEAVATGPATRWYFPVDIDFYTVSFGLGRWLASNVRHFDVVHVHGLFSFAPNCAALLARAAGVPYVMRPFGVLLPYGMARRRPGLKKRSFALLERRLLEAAAAVQFSSRLEQDEAAALGLKCNGALIPLGIDVGPLDTRPEPEATFNLLFIGRIDPVKNLESLIAALAAVRGGGTDVRLHLVGDGDAAYVVSLKTLAKRLGAGACIDWLGQVEGERKTELLDAASAFVLPSHSESFGIAAVEALAAGLPCVVSRAVAIASDIAEGGAGIVTGTDAPNIAAGIAALIAREDLAAMSSAAHRLAASRFSRDVMGERLAALYRAVAAPAGRPMPEPFDIVIAPGRAERNYWRDLWRYRELFQVLAWRDVAVRYKQTVIGGLWAVIRPLLTMIIFTVVFGWIAKLPSEGAAPYALMVFAGLLPWTFFAMAVNEASGSLTGNANLIGKVYFPRMIVPAAAVMVALADFLISLVILVGLLVWYRVTPDWRLLLLPLFMLMALLASLGSGLWLAALNVKYRDFRYIIPFIVQLGLYISPVGFSSSIVPSEWRLLYSLNPMVGVIDGFRWCILGGASALYWPGLAISLSVIASLLWFGIRRFRSAERGFADMI